MKYALLVGIILVVFAAMASPARADTFTLGSYTITVTPDDPLRPYEKGTVTVAGSSDNATVTLHGVYMTIPKPRALVMDLRGRVSTPEAIYDVQRRFTFRPDQVRFVWRAIITWVESLTKA